MTAALDSGMSRTVPLLSCHAGTRVAFLLDGLHDGRQLDENQSIQLKGCFQCFPRMLDERVRVNLSCPPSGYTIKPKYGPTSCAIIFNTKDGNE